MTLAALIAAGYFLIVALLTLALFALYEWRYNRRQARQPAGEVIHFPARLRVVEEPELALYSAPVIPLRRDWERAR